MLLQGKISDQDLTRLNTKLKDYYGSEGDNLPKFRVVWSSDRFEKRVVTHTTEGLQLLHPEIQERPVYAGWNMDRYVLEGFTDIPEFAQHEFLEKYSYEPIYTFENDFNQALIPDWRVCRIIIETIRHNVEHGVAKYTDPMLEPESAKEEQKKSVDRIYNEYFGNESDIADSLMLGSGIIVPGQFKKDN